MKLKIRTSIITYLALMFFVLSFYFLVRLVPAFEIVVFRSTCNAPMSCLLGRLLVQIQGGVGSVSESERCLILSSLSTYSISEEYLKIEADRLSLASDIIDSGVNPNCDAGHGLKAVHFAILDNNTVYLRFLVKRGAKITSVFIGGVERTPEGLVELAARRSPRRNYAAISTAVSELTDRP
jgi:hypothetical protein